MQMLTFTYSETVTGDWPQSGATGTGNPRSNRGNAWNYFAFQRGVRVLITKRTVQPNYMQRPQRLTVTGD